MKINKDFFKFSEGQIRNYEQPHFQKYSPETEEAEIASTTVRTTSTSTTTTTPRPKLSTTTRATTPSTTTSDDVLYITPKTRYTYKNKNAKIQKLDKEESSNSIEHDDSNISYQKQMMDFREQKVLDFAVESSQINGACSLQLSLILAILSTFVFQILHLLIHR